MTYQTCVYIFKHLPSKGFMIKYLIIIFFWTNTLFAFNRYKSPFLDVNFKYSPSVVVNYQGKAYFLISINGVRRNILMNKCKKIYSFSCHCMFSNNFVELMSVMGFDLGEKFNIELYEFKTHKVHNFKSQLVRLPDGESRKNQQVVSNYCQLKI